MSVMILLLFIFNLGVDLSTAKNNRILLRNVEVLTFNKDYFTKSRRGYSIPELNCVGGSAYGKKSYYPSTVQCYNRGYDGQDVQWECKAELNKAVKFGSINVNCEGFDHPEDDYVLFGSCGLEYDLDFVNGKQDTWFFQQKYSDWFGKRSGANTFLYSAKFGPYLGLVVLLIAAFGIWYYCLRPNVNPQSVHEHQSPYPRPMGDPPSYDEAVRHGCDHNTYTRHRTMPSAPPPAADTDWSAPPEPGWSIPTTSSRFFRSQPKTHSDTSWSTFGNLASGAAGFFGGYWLGSSNNRSTASCSDSTHQSRSSPSSTNFAEHVQQETRVATGYGRTKRR